MMLTDDDGDDGASSEFIMLRLYFVSTCHFPPYVLPWHVHPITGTAEISEASIQSPELPETTWKFS